MPIEVKLYRQFYFTSPLLFYMNLQICFRHLVLLEMISFENLKSSLQRRLSYSLNEVSMKF